MTINYYGTGNLAIHWLQILLAFLLSSIWSSLLSNIRHIPIISLITISNCIWLGEYVDLFVENGLDDLEVVKDLTMDILRDIGVDKIGHRMKIIKYIDKLDWTTICFFLFIRLKVLLRPVKVRCVGASVHCDENLQDLQDMF